MLLRDGLFLLATVLLWIGGKNAIAIVDQNDDKKEEKKPRRENGTGGITQRKDGGGLPIYGRRLNQIISI